VHVDIPKGEATGTHACDTKRQRNLKTKVASASASICREVED
jgi:hypothetical protein